LIIYSSTNLIIFNVAVRSRARAIDTCRNQMQKRTTTHGQIQSFEIGRHTGNREAGRKRKKERVSRRDVKILINMALMLVIFLFGWAPIYFLATFAPSLANGSPFLYILGSFPSYSLLCNIVLLYRYNHALRQHLVIIFRNKWRLFI
jgi:hypothetical protein